MGGAEERYQRLLQRVRELEEANDELTQKNRILEKLAQTDPLTGLLNRRGVDRIAERTLRRRRRVPGRRQDACLLNFDLGRILIVTLVRVTG